METLTMGPIETAGPLQEALKDASCASNHAAHMMNDPHEDDTSWTEESFIDESLVSGCDDDLLVEECTVEDEKNDNYDGTSSTPDQNKQTNNNRQGHANRFNLKRTTKAVGNGGGACSTTEASLNSADKSDGDVSFIIIEETIEYDERTVSDFIGSSGDYMDLEVTETEVDVIETEETPEDDNTQDDDIQSTGVQSAAFSLKLPMTSTHGHRSFDSVSTISFNFDDVEASESTELTELQDSVVFLTDCAGSVVTRDSVMTAQTPISTAQSIKTGGPQLSLSMHTASTIRTGPQHCLSMHTQQTMVSTDVSAAAVVDGMPVAPIRPMRIQDLEKSNTIISNVTRNININRKKDGKQMEISRNILSPSKEGRDGGVITRRNSWGALTQRRRAHERNIQSPSKEGSEGVTTRRNSWGAHQRRRAKERRGGKKVRHKSMNEVGGVNRNILSPSLSQTGNSHLVDGSERSNISLSQSGSSQIDDSDRIIFSPNLSQSGKSLSPGILKSRRRVSSQSLRAQGMPRSSSWGRLPLSGSSNGLRKSGSGTELSRIGNVSRLRRSSSGNRLDRIPNASPRRMLSLPADGGSSGNVNISRLRRSNSGNRLDRIPNANPPRRMLSRNNSGKFVLRDESSLSNNNNHRAASGSSDRRMVGGGGVVDRVHLVHMAVGPSNRRMLARANSAKKLVLDDHRQTGSHSRTGIFKIEESKDLLFAKSMH